MPRFAANLTYLFKELPFLERFEAAAEAGFQGVEVLFPYDDAASEIVRRLKRADLPLVLINAPPPNWTGGQRGFAALPGGEDRFKRDFKRCLRYAQRLGSMHVHIMAGKAEGTKAKETFIRNLAWAAEEAPSQSLTIEPLCATEMPGYFLHDFETATEVLDAIAAPNLGLQFDAYHAQAITGDVMKTWESVANLVRHIQVAGSPGGNEPNTGDIDYREFFHALDEFGYGGFVSGKYFPKNNTFEGLSWMKMGQRK